MEAVEKLGRTVEEAVASALADLGISQESAVIEVLEEPSKGLFGILGSRPARVRVSVRETPSYRARQLLEKIFEAMSLAVNLEIKEKDNDLLINLSGNGLGILIGRRGETLNALQYLVNLCVNKNQLQKTKVILDVEGYRQRREQTLERLALRLAEKAKQRGRNIVLEPMNPQERRIIHTALQGRDDIYTYSEGEEPFRKIVISPRR
ncbi:MAG: protein jag [Armatimonadetes bacterium]|nr:protein jag [Armatimonadota bacterium]